MRGKKTEKGFYANSTQNKSQKGDTEKRERKRLLLNGADNTTKEAGHRHRGEKRKRIVLKQ